MLKGDNNENGFKTNRSNQQKNKLHVQHTFSSNYQKTNLHVQHAILSFPYRWRNCRMCLPNILFPVFMFAFIFHCRSFSPCWPLVFLIFSPPLGISRFFFLRNSSPLKKTRLGCCFFLSKSPGGHVISFQLHLGCHTC